MNDMQSRIDRRFYRTVSILTKHPLFLLRPRLYPLIRVSCLLSTPLWNVRGSYRTHRLTCIRQLNPALPFLRERLSTNDVEHPEELPPLGNLLRYRCVQGRANPLGGCSLRYAIGIHLILLRSLCTW